MLYQKSPEKKRHKIYRKLMSACDFRSAPNVLGSTVSFESTATTEMCWRFDPKVGTRSATSRSQSSPEESGKQSENYSTMTNSRLEYFCTLWSAYKVYCDMAVSKGWFGQDSFGWENGADDQRRQSLCPQTRCQREGANGATCNL